MDGRILHGRNDDSLNVSASVADVVHGRVPAVLRIIFVAMVGTFFNIVEVLSIRIHELDFGAIPIYINNRP